MTYEPVSGFNNQIKRVSLLGSYLVSRHCGAKYSLGAETSPRVSHRWLCYR